MFFLVTCTVANKPLFVEKHTKMNVNTLIVYTYWTQVAVNLHTTGSLKIPDLLRAKLFTRGGSGISRLHSKYQTQNH